MRTATIAAPLPMREARGPARQWIHESRTRALLWLTLIFWGSSLLIQSLGTILTGNPHVAEITVMRIVTTVFGLALCYAIHRILAHPALSTIRRSAIALAIVAPVAAEMFAWAIYFAEAAVDPVVRSREFTWSGAVRTVAFWTWFFLAWAGLYLAINYSFDVQMEQQQAAELREQAHVAQLRALHSQINPHFLFNSLNSVSALILDQKADSAEQMVAKLAGYLRMGLAMDPLAKIPMSTELALQRTYLEIEQLRYDDLRIDVDVPKDLDSALVPAFILQPIVENAVKYGVAGSPPPSRIGIAAARDGSRLVLEVTDAGTGTASTPAGTGIGLANARERLLLIYGRQRADLIARHLPDGGFKVRLSFPLEFA